MTWTFDLDFNTAARRLPELEPIDWEQRLEALRSALKARALPLVREVFPMARVGPREARIGNLQGEVGESLSIELQGEKAGQWIDHATGECGDLIDLWKETSSCEFVAAVEDLEGWCNLEPPPRFQQIAAVRRFAADTQPKPVDPTAGPPTVRHVYTDPHGNVLGAVLRWDFVNAKGEKAKTFKQENERGQRQAPAVRPLYNQPALASAVAAVLVEGEKCAEALMGLGIPATTAMGGANAKTEATDWSPLAGKKVLIWPDNDQPGQDYAARVRPVLEGLGCRVSVVAIPPGKPPKWDAADAVAEGADINAILNAAAANPAPGGRLRPMSFKQAAQLPEPEWLIEDVLPEKCLGLLFGPYGSLKSFVALDMALHIATGRPWHGKDVQRQPVMYVAGEGQAGLTKRVAGWLKARGLTADDIEGWFFMEGTLTSLVDQAEELAQVCVELKIGMLVVDTVAQTFGAGDEQAAKEMNVYLGAGKLVARAAEAMLLWVHHSGKDEEKGARGSTVLPAGVDVAMKVKKTKRGVVLMNEGVGCKMKDAEPFAEVTFQASKIEVGETRKGKVIDTLVLSLEAPEVVEEVTEEQWAEARRGAAREAAAGGNVQRAVLSQLRAARDNAMGRNEEDQGLDRASLLAFTGENRGSVDRALKPLIERGLVEVAATRPLRWRAT